LMSTWEEHSSEFINAYPQDSSARLTDGIPFLNIDKQVLRPQLAT
jgi:hypothetical protein